MVGSVPRMCLLAFAITGVSSCIPLGPEQHISLLPNLDSWEAKRAELSKEPVGIHVRADSQSYSSLKAIVEITAKNNSESSISKLFVEVLLFRGTRQVGQANVVFESLAPGDKEHIEQHTKVEKYVWDDYTVTYKIEK